MLPPQSSSCPLPSLARWMGSPTLPARVDADQSTAWPLSATGVALGQACVRRSASQSPRDRFTEHPPRPRGPQAQRSQRRACAPRPHPQPGLSAAVIGSGLGLGPEVDQSEPTLELLVPPWEKHASSPLGLPGARLGLSGQPPPPKNAGYREGSWHRENGKSNNKSQHELA